MLLENISKSLVHFNLQLCSFICSAFVSAYFFLLGLDWGGLRREWFELICRELFDPNASGLFCRFKEDPQALVRI